MRKLFSPLNLYSTLRLLLLLFASSPFPFSFFSSRTAGAQAPGGEARIERLPLRRRLELLLSPFSSSEAEDDDEEEDDDDDEELLALAPSRPLPAAASAPLASSGLFCRSSRSHVRAICGLPCAASGQTRAKLLEQQ